MKGRFGASRSGFSMVELIIATFILIFGIATFLTVIGSSLRLQNISADFIAAHNAARGEIEKLRSFAVAEWTAFPGNYYAQAADKEMSGSIYVVHFNIFGALGSGVRAYDSMNPNRDGKVEIFQESGVTGTLWRAKVQVQWRPSKGRLSTLKLETLVAKM